MSDCRPHLRPFAAFADGPVAHHSEPVTPQPVVTSAEPDGYDRHTMQHD